MGQKDFNRIIDLLGDAISAETNLRTLTIENQYRCKPEFDKAFDAYINAVTELYAPLNFPKKYPVAFRKAYQSRSMQEANAPLESGIIENKIWFLFNISDIVNQLNKDFVLVKIETEKGIHYIGSPLTYTGKYKHVDINGIYNSSFINPTGYYLSCLASKSHRLKHPNIGVNFLNHSGTGLFAGALFLLGISMTLTDSNKINDSNKITPGFLLSLMGGCWLASHIVSKAGFFANPITVNVPMMGNIETVSDNLALF